MRPSRRGTPNLHISWSAAVSAGPAAATPHLRKRSARCGWSSTQPRSGTVWSIRACRAISRLIPVRDRFILEMPIPQARPWLLVIFLFLLLTSARLMSAPSEVVIDFEKAEITGRWVESWEDKGVVFTPAHPPKKSKAKARLMFFPHLPDGRKGILSAMADDPIPVRARFTNNCSSATVVFWGSTGCPARLEAYDADGQLLDKAALDVIPGRKAPGDPIPTFELTVKGTNIAYIEFSGPRPGEYLAADELRFVPISTAGN